MCLISTSKDPVVADKDIPVWKIVCTDGEKWVGPCLYDDFGYPFNVVNTAKAIPPGDPVEYLGTGHYAVKSGHFHTFAQKTSALYRFDNMHNSHYQKRKGYYGYCRQNVALNFPTVVLCKATIPKGTEYYKDEYCYASKQLIVHKPE